MPPKTPSPLTLSQAVQLFKMLGDEQRLRILLLLQGRGEMTVGALCAEVGCMQPAMSHHLALLRMSGLVSFRREGKNNFYRAVSEAARQVLRLIKF